MVGFFLLFIRLHRQRREERHLLAIDEGLPFRRASAPKRADVRPAAEGRRIAHLGSDGPHDSLTIVRTARWVGQSNGAISSRIARNVADRVLKSWP
jgi:hypothetical protein